MIIATALLQRFIHNAQQNAVRTRAYGFGYDTDYAEAGGASKIKPEHIFA